LIASVGPNPGRAVYAATKAYVDEWSTSLAEEHWDTIDILTVKPGMISTKFVDYEKSKERKMVCHFTCTIRQINYNPIGQGFKHIRKLETWTPCLIELFLPKMLYQKR